MIVTLIGIMIVLLLLGFPMLMSMIVSPLAVTLIYFPNINATLLIQQLVAGVQPFVLLAVPMFIFAADIMCAGKTANRLLDFVEKFVGHIHGGMAITTATACTLFGAISGSTQATVVAIGKPMRQKLLKMGYDDSDAMALIINASDIALLIPPSIGMIMYAVVTGASVGELFIAGIGPGLVLLVCFSIYSYIFARKNNIPRTPKASIKEKMRATKKALLPLGFPVIIIGGIYSGIFSPTEAAAASVLYAVILEVVVYKAIKIKELYNIALSTGLVTAAVFILVGGGQAFSWLISYAKIPQMMTSVLLGGSPSPLRILLTVTIFYFVGCMFVDPIVVIIILTPIFYPLAMAAGIDPIHLGILITLQSAIGSATPPFGCDIFTACAVFEKPYLEVIRKTPPYIFILVVISIIMIFFPGIALFFRDLVFS
ncbi:TRAP transporter large permease [Ilyobacter polytropus]|uniref:TRAP dicarboxylate transporter, DctM subunit n=1 Tax=Ilyobacter polytropus (strain ATCC 51220 / DSM 2926 / LMG 16218 / CuHBu1) TaxID=572544 RepID=E3H6K3_ILYPC|nr:TRAP transporter large permease [Ilyobacter polytropus]ADO81888.1 TRAP dicarboxylate transporter, DctM subunit [Ilyobacter polytropus DSM 2926]